MMLISAENSLVAWHGADLKHEVLIVTAAVSLNDEGKPIHTKISPRGFTAEEIGRWAQSCLGTGCAVLSDGLACFRSVIDSGCEHRFIVTGGCHPNDLPEFPLDQHGAGQPQDQPQRYVSCLQ
jgi:hypothetical protein